jgi:hypothetical protein
MLRDAGPKPVSILKIDKDCHVEDEWLSDYTRLVITTCQQHGVNVKRIKMCRSQRKGLHFYVDIEPSIEAELANELQWLLGDDCLRVDFNRARVQSKLDEWNKLFEVPNVRFRTIYRAKQGD